MMLLKVFTLFEFLELQTLCAFYSLTVCTVICSRNNWKKAGKYTKVLYHQANLYESIYKHSFSTLFLLFSLSLLR